ncbi:M28 family metallopeptidase [Pedobacter sp. BMA]|uniref:M28 family metallopeptidase n=1 Tax=Pedobacter sp. BMA TaxID=1663685 RepID=UPI0006493C6A|nr:M28 family peptidase [Pedobacter sp. BMA]KLT64876.1 aminopeptidase [Pedobacter sp. BMA]
MRRSILYLLCLAVNICSAQDSAYVRKTINHLTSPRFWGRGYTKDGMKKAADFISGEYKSIGLLPLSPDYQQDFAFAVNTFPGKMQVSVNGKKLEPGKDFIVSNESQGIRAKANLDQLDSARFAGQPNIRVILKNKLTWSVASEVAGFTEIQIDRNKFNDIPKQINVDIENHLIDNFKASNVCGLVKGTEFPDSVMVITAHYDHLGGMGSDTYFPGANDNAAGVATLLSLAKYYASHPQAYSIAFICFAAEEAGLLGSRYYVENPLFPLASIKFLLNLDLVGTGDAGMAVVNATVYPKAFSILNALNDQQQLISKITKRGKAANSDHYFFTEKGVPAFFIYTQGGPPAYHDVFDTADGLPLTEYNDLFKLIVEFNKNLMAN